MLPNYGSLPGLIILSATLVSGAALPEVLSRDLSSPNLFTSIVPSANLTWSPCLGTLFCAVLDVPLDYEIPGGTRAFVPLIKYAATTTPYKGMVLTNPGGPGESAIEWVIATGANISTIVGSNYDLIAWEPRGIGYSMPLANCGSPTNKSRVARHLPNQPYGPRLPLRFFQDEYQFIQNLGTRCQKSIGGINDAGPHMSTGVVVRDMISILDAYSASSYSTGAANPSLLNFWGISYGTLIGQTFASMFPARVGRVVLDGFLDADDYMDGLGLKNLQFSDEAFSTFFVYCNLAGATACPFYTGSTAHDIFLRFEQIVLRLDAKKAAHKGWANATAIYLGLEALKLIAVRSTYEPNAGFANLAEVLLFFDSAVQNISMVDINNLYATAGTPLILHPTGDTSEWEAGIACTDNRNALLGKSLLSLKPVALIMQLQSWVFWEVFAAHRIACINWSIIGKGLFTGKFGGSTKNPILLVSNTRDPVTPIFNGEKGTRLFKNSQLLTIDGTGHTSFAAPNICAYTKINAYFQTGAFPGTKNFCALEAGPFGVVASGSLLRRDLQAVGVGMRALREREVEVGE